MATPSAVPENLNKQIPQSWLQKGNVFYAAPWGWNDPVIGQQTKELEGKKFKKHTVKNIKSKSYLPSGTVEIHTNTLTNKYGNGMWSYNIYGPYNKYYSVKNQPLKRFKNAAQKILPHMLAYSARPPKTMGEENTGGLVYKLWEQKVTAAHPNTFASTRRRRNQTRRRR